MLPKMTDMTDTVGHVINIQTLEQKIRTSEHVFSSWFVPYAMRSSHHSELKIAINSENEIFF